MAGPCLDPVLIEACLNGSRSAEDHPALPITPDELATQARAVVEAGAAVVHVHPRDGYGRETLDPGPAGDAVVAMREACPDALLSLTTGFWIQPDRAARAAAISAWTARPDMVSVNFSDPGAIELCEMVLAMSIGVEAGLSSIADARLLVSSGLADRCVRALIEPDEPDPATAPEAAALIDALLEHHGLDLPRLHHGYGLATWPVLDAALMRGLDVRIGLEDTLVLPDGTEAEDNAQLVAEAVSMARRHAVGG